MAEIRKVVIKTGFKDIKCDFLRDSTLRKGKNLLESNHVFDVEESEGVIKGKVIRQTSVNAAPYTVSIQTRALHQTGSGSDSNMERIICGKIAKVILTRLTADKWDGSEPDGVLQLKIVKTEGACEGIDFGGEDASSIHQIKIERVEGACEEAFGVEDASSIHQVSSQSPPTANDDAELSTAHGQATIKTECSVDYSAEEEVIKKEIKVEKEEGNEVAEEEEEAEENGRGGATGEGVGAVNREEIEASCDVKRETNAGEFGESDGRVKQEDELIISDLELDDEEEEEDDDDDEPCNKSHIQGRAVRFDRKTLKCEICGKTLSSKSNLIRHMRLHSGERPYKCSTCNKGFSVKSNLIVHERTHSGERPYKCKTCNKGFSGKSDLIKHERIHSGERPYKCTTCDKGFAQKNHLIFHERSHSGERPYKCTTCDKGFAQKSVLITHERIHSGEKPYGCSKCNYRSSDSSNLRTHTQRKHPL